MSSSVLGPGPGNNARGDESCRAEVVVGIGSGNTVTRSMAAGVAMRAGEGGR